MKAEWKIRCYTSEEIAHITGGVLVPGTGGSYPVRGICTDSREAGPGMPNREEAALADAARAIRVIRSRAKELHVDPDKIGVIGFSAGGNLAARVSAPDRDEPYEQKDGIDKLNFRPNFAMLIYPAYLTDLRKLFDMELKTKVKVDKRTPPTFIVQTQDDGIKVENALAWYIQLRKAGVSIEMHLFPNGGHGYGIMRRGMSVDIWPDLAYRWMKTIKLNIH